jgi:hypothetical protein
VVHANTKTLMSCDIVSDTVGNIVVAIVLINIIGVLSLEEVRRTTVTIPLHKVFQQVLCRKSHHSHIIAIDTRPNLTGIVAFHNKLPSRSMIRTPSTLPTITAAWPFRGTRVARHRPKST